MKGRTGTKASLWRRRSTGLLTVGVVLAIIWKSASPSSSVPKKEYINIERDFSKIEGTSIMRRRKTNCFRDCDLNIANAAVSGSRAELRLKVVCNSYIKSQ